MWLLAAPSVLETGNTSSHWLSFLPIQILFGVELSEKLTHGKDFQWLKNIKVRPQFYLHYHLSRKRLFGQAGSFLYILPYLKERDCWSRWVISLHIIFSLGKRLFGCLLAEMAPPIATLTTHNKNYLPHFYYINYICSTIPGYH